MSSKEKTRSSAADMGRAMAIFAVVMAHVMRRGFVTDALGTLGVSYFLFLGGYFLRIRENMLKSFGNALKRLYFPYLIVGLFSIAFYGIAGAAAGEQLGIEGVNTDWKFNLWGLFYANSKDGGMKWNESLWYVPCYLLMILIGLLVLKVRESRREAVLILSMAGSIFAARIITGMYHLHLPWQTETALHLYPLFALGMFWHILFEKNSSNLFSFDLFGSVPVKKKIEYSAVTAVLGILLLICYFGYVYFIRQTRGSAFSLRTDQLPGFPLSLAGPVIGIVAVVLLAASLPRWKIIEYVGRHSFAIMLWNKFPVLAVQLLTRRMFPAMANLYIENESFTGSALGALIAILCVALCLLWEKCYRVIFLTFYKRFSKNMIKCKE